jgi:hypothetical protein
LYSGEEPIQPVVDEYVNHGAYKALEDANGRR